MTWAWAVVIPAFIAWVAYLLARPRPRPLVRPLPSQYNPGLSLIRDAMREPAQLRRVVHLYAPEGAAFETGCCGRDVFALPEDHRTTPHRDKVTCAGGGS